jgi:telomere resolvase
MIVVAGYICPQLPKYVSAAFGSMDKPWKPGHLRSAYAAICCHRFKPQNQTDDIFLAQILGHKLLGLTHPSL